MKNCCINQTDILFNISDGVILEFNAFLKELNPLVNAVNKV